MLKKLFLVCVAVLVTTLATAQVTVNRGDYGSQQQKVNSFSPTKNSAFAYKFGVKAGLNMTNMSNGMQFEPGFDMGLGFRAGALVNLRWGMRTENSKPGTGVWGVQPELLYSCQSVKSEAGNIKLNYVSLPVMLKAYITTCLNLEVGPELSYLISAAPSTMAVGGAEIRVSECKGLNVGASAGISYDVETGFTVGVRYTSVFTDMAKNLKWKNNNVQITVGWMF